MDPYRTPCTNINSKWIKDLNVRPETRKFLEENISRKLLAVDLSNDFWGLTLKAEATKEKINKWDYIKLKRFCTAREKNQQNEKAPYGMGENICKPYIW